jgi:hypothetical protein
MKTRKFGKVQNGPQLRTQSADIKNLKLTLPGRQLIFHLIL